VAIDRCYICSLTEEGFGFEGGTKAMVSVYKKDYANSVKYVIGTKYLGRSVCSAIFLLNSCGCHLTNTRVTTDRTGMLCNTYHSGFSEESSIRSVTASECLSSHRAGCMTCKSREWSVLAACGSSTGEMSPVGSRVYVSYLFFMKLSQCFFGK
jgi:hypothetical protein